MNDGRVFYFKSKTSPGAKPYQTTRHGDGSIMCSCLGFRHPNKCWHVAEVRKQYPLSDEKWAQALQLMKEARYPELLEIIIDAYPSMTREMVPPMIKALCEWICPLCNAIGQSPRHLGCTKCSPED